MEWSNPILVDLRMGGVDSARDCTDGSNPKIDCWAGGSEYYQTCWGGSEIAWEICVEGGSLSS